MSTHEQPVLSLYRSWRHRSQRDYYIRRLRSLEAAYTQSVVLTGGLMFLAAVFAALAAADATNRVAWAILGAACPALSAAISAYTGMNALDQQSRLYEDAARSLLDIEALDPDIQPGLMPDGASAAMTRYVEAVEGVLAREQGQWGQLVSDLSPLQAPAQTNSHHQP